MPWYRLKNYTYPVHLNMHSTALQAFILLLHVPAYKLFIQGWRQKGESRETGEEVSAF